MNKPSDPARVALELLHKQGFLSFPRPGDYEDGIEIIRAAYAERDDLKSKLARTAEQEKSRLDILEDRVAALEGKSMLSQGCGPVPIVGDPRTEGE